MDYKIFDTEDEAMEYSHEAALANGHGNVGNTIQYWYSWKETANGKWAVQCPEGTEQPKFIEEINNETN